MSACAQPITLPANNPAPYGALPNAPQIAWQEMETYAFLHFGLNTFTGKEWGYGDESSALFNPVDFDADKIVAPLQAAGFQGVVLVAKHHDGFALWPSKYTEHSVKNSPWKNGQGDVVQEVSDACRRAGLKFGVYLSPWDRNHAEYGRAAYVEYYRDQLRELLTNYGEIFMVWMDGANGGDGYYGGARETRSINAQTYYEADKLRALVDELQPNAVIFGPFPGNDIRWIGNEAGRAPDTVWETTQPGGDGAGVRGGAQWRPAEMDVSIRPGWFYHANEDSRVKTPQQLVDIYFNAVGRGADLHLNFPPNKRGLLGETDIVNAREMRRILDEIFKTNLAANAKVTASATRTGDFAATGVLDAKRATFWAAPDDAKSAELIFELPKPTTFDVVLLQEVIELGQRLDGFALDIWENDGWREILKKQSVGYKRLDRLSTPVTATTLRLRLHAPVAPVLASFGLYLQPPDAKAKAQNTLDLGYPKTKWKVITATEQVGPAANAIDGNPSTLWHTHSSQRGELPPPQNIVVDLNETLNLKGFNYLPRQDGTPRGMVTHAKFELSVDGTNWTQAWEGEFSNVAANPILQTITFDRPLTARYFRFTGEKAAAANHVAVAEVGVVTK
jgi:alpha-L-fucosidase